MFLLDLSVISVGFTMFLVDHCLDTTGWMVLKSLKPISTCCPEQYGHPLPRFLLLGLASHSCPFSQIHQTFLPDPTVMLDINTVFREDHCRLKSGATVTKSLKQSKTRCPEQ